MLGKASILSMLLLAAGALMAQQPASWPHSGPEKEGTAVTHAALKGCLSSTAVGDYRLADDETGAVYNLVGNRETLRMLVGTDVLVTGQNLETGPNRSQDRPTGTDDKSQTESDAALYAAGSVSAGTNSFRVLNAIKVADVCFLSTRQSAALLAQ